MIIDFTITNFLSIKETQVFSLYAETIGTHLLENIAYPTKDKKIGVLKCAGLYGANASGKSNILKAFKALSSLIDNSGNLKEDEPIPEYQPFLLAEDTKIAPVAFEIEVIISGIRYVYKIAFTQQKIVAESLLFYPANQPALIFDRKPDVTWQDIKFGSLYKGGTKRIPLFANHAYLSKAGNSPETPEMIRDVYNYFRHNLRMLEVNMKIFTINWNDKLLNKLGSILSLVDTGISSIQLVQEQTFPEDIFNNMPESMKEKILHSLPRSLPHKLKFAHKADSGESVLFELQQESDGTQRFFSLAHRLMLTLENSGVLIIDELDHSLHPFMAELIIKLFNDPRVNKNNAQLIFTTHNIHLMTPELLRRDQIWFTQKYQGITSCYSLDQFDKNKVKATSPFSEWYAEGRFGAVPSIDYEKIVELFTEATEDHAQEAQ